MSRTRIILPIEGMSCASCAATVQEALAGAGGVVSAAVNYATAKAAVDYDDAQTNVTDLLKTVREAGYNCGKASVTFTVEQLHYAPSVVPLDCCSRSPAPMLHGGTTAPDKASTQPRSVDHRTGSWCPGGSLRS